jgi:hypothetical protein
MWLELYPRVRILQAVQEVAGLADRPNGDGGCAQGKCGAGHLRFFSSFSLPRSQFTPVELFHSSREIRMYTPGLSGSGLSKFPIVHRVPSAK